MTTYAANERDRYEPPACPRCGHRAEVRWCNIRTLGDAEDRFIPGDLLCSTPGCVDDRGSNRVPAKRA